MVSDDLCDHCDSATALLYCRADSARLCFACDRHVHAANALFNRHSRSLLCDSCANSPATIFCSDHSSVLCHDCDWASHRSPAPTHLRRPIEGFVGCPKVSDFLAILGFEDLDEKAVLGDLNANLNDCCDDLFMWDLIPCDEGFEGLVVPNVMDVPPLPKNRNAVCGRYKDEVLSQLRKMAQTEPDEPRKCETKEEEDVEANAFRNFEGSSCQWFDDVGHRDFPQSKTYVDESFLDSDKHSDVGDCLSYGNNDQVEQSQNPVDSKASPGFQKVVAYEISSQERETAISRYKEKRKSRSFNKRIRYESRKVRAESRTRIKGRFAKIEH